MADNWDEIEQQRNRHNKLNTVIKAGGAAGTIYIWVLIGLLIAVIIIATLYNQMVK